MWPWYADGPCYIFPRETVPRLLDIAKVVRTIPTDDVFFGGVLAEVAGFPRIHVKQIAIEVFKKKNHVLHICRGFFLVDNVLLF